jgi:hypothetical protein
LAIVKVGLVCFFEALEDAHYLLHILILRWNCDGATRNDAKPVFGGSTQREDDPDLPDTG